VIRDDLASNCELR